MNKSIVTAVSAGALSLALAGPLFAAGEYGSEDSSAMGTSPEASAGTMGQAAISDAWKASDLSGIDVQNNQGDDLGTISEVFISPDGNVSHVVLSKGGALGIGGEQYLVPWERLQLSKDQDLAILDVQEDQISSEFAAFEEMPEDAGTTMEQQPTDGMGEDTGSM